MKKVFKKISGFVLVYIGIALMFFTLMYATYSLPNSRIRGHIAESAGQLASEGLGYSPFFQQSGATLDTHTDALIFNIAMNKGINDEESTIQKCVNNSFHESADAFGVTSLQENISDEVYNNHEYTRYWHGIQTIIRPLLIFFNYMEIRYILMLVIFTLFAIATSMIGKQLGTKISIAFAIAVSMMYIIIVPTSIQYSSIFIVTLISVISILEVYKHKKEKLLPVVFFIIGALATFFDLLTYPLITLGMPLILAIIFENRKQEKLYKQILMVIKLGIFWSLGYGLLFFTKWLIASIILNKDAITLALNEILFRVNGSEQVPIDRIDTVITNFEYFFIPTAKCILVLITAIWLIMVVLYRKKLKDCKNIVTLLIISIIPYVWYIIFSGHSGIHAWFTNRIQSITVFAILSAMFEFIDENKIGRFVKNKKKIIEVKNDKD